MAEFTDRAEENMKTLDNMTSEQLLLMISGKEVPEFIKGAERDAYEENFAIRQKYFVDLIIMWMFGATVNIDLPPFVFEVDDLLTKAIPVANWQPIIEMLNADHEIEIENFKKLMVIACKKLVWGKLETKPEVILDGEV